MSKTLWIHKGTKHLPINGTTEQSNKASSPIQGKTNISPSGKINGI